LKFASVFTGQPVSAEDSQQLEWLASYITRPPLAIDSIRRPDDGRLEIGTPPDPRTGATVRTFDPLDWISYHHRPHPGSRPTPGEVLWGAVEPRTRKLSVPSSGNP